MAQKKETTKKTAAAPKKETAAATKKKTAAVKKETAAAPKKKTAAAKKETAAAPKKKTAAVNYGVIAGAAFSYLIVEALLIIWFAEGISHM